MTIEKAEWTISSLSESVITMVKSSDELIPLNLLQRICALLGTLTSQIPTPTQLGFSNNSASVVVQCKNAADLSSICHLQTKIISGDFTHTSEIISLSVCVKI